MTIAVLGEALMDLVPCGENRYRSHPGGSPYNVAIGLARQNLDVYYMSPLSDDEPGNQLYASLSKEGVTAGLERRSTLPTSLALITLNEQGIPAYRLYREGIADKDFTGDEILANLPADLRLFHTGSLAITPSQLPKIRAVFGALRERGVVISVDVNIRLGASQCNELYLAGVRSLLPDCDIVKASDEDLKALRPNEDIMQASRLVLGEMGGGLMVTTLGGEGAAVHYAGGVIQRRASPVSNLVDTIGAGDTFHSAFLSELIQNDALTENFSELSQSTLIRAIDFASAAAAINVSRSGCQPPTRSEVEALLSKH